MPGFLVWSNSLVERRVRVFSRGWVVWWALVFAGALSCSDHTVSLFVGSGRVGVVQSHIAAPAIAVQRASTVLRLSQCPRTGLSAWLRLRGGFGSMTAQGVQVQTKTSTRAQAHMRSTDGVTEAEECSTADGGSRSTLLSRTCVEEGFVELQGELAPYADEQGYTENARAEERAALQQRVGHLCRSAIALFRSQLLLASRQRQREKQGGREVQKNSQKRGLLVLFEGLDRSGKGTQVQLLIGALEVRNFESRVTCSRLSRAQKVKVTQNRWRAILLAAGPASSCRLTDLI